MKTMQLQEFLKQEAIKLGLCQQWQDEWGNPDVDELCQKFIRGQDFCIKHDFPNVGHIREYFKREDLERNGIYCQPDVVASSVGQKNVIAMGNAMVDVYVQEDSICDIYVRHDSKVNLHVGDRAFVYVTMRDNGELEIKSKGQGAKIKSSVFSGTIDKVELIDTIHYK